MCLPSSSSKDNNNSRKTAEELSWFPFVFAWVHPLFQRARTLAKEGKALEHDDLLELPAVDDSQRIGKDFKVSWESNTDNNEKTIKDLRKALLNVMGRRFVIAGMVKLINTLLQFTFPLLLNAILQYIEDTQRGNTTDEYRGYWLTVLLFLAMASKAVTENAYFHLVYRAGYQAKVAVSVAVYEKSLNLAPNLQTSLGEMVNLMQVDASKLELFVPQVHVLWDGLLQITGYITILYTLIGWPCLLGLIVMIVAGPLQGIIMKKLLGLNRDMVKHTDARVKSVNEALQGIQTLKMFAWESRVAANIQKSRMQELKNLKGVAYLTGFSRAYMGALPGIVAVTSFITFALASNSEITASTLFAALAAFEQLRFPLLFYPMALAQYSQATISASRVHEFLLYDEIDRDTTHYQRKAESGTHGITVNQAEIYWSDPNVPIDHAGDTSDDESSVNTKQSQQTATLDKEESADMGTPRYPKAILNDVSFSVKQGELCAVIGRVGSGKSTLCSAILGETVLKEGAVQLDGRVAYAAQTPWILNATLRDNILFGRPYDEEKYQAVLKACQLTHDLALLDFGDQTEIGERGINLSGGQKQRVSVARAAYADADVVFLDDPLSALDPQVARQLFEECILGLLKDKTVFFVTNQLQFLQHCDQVVVLGKKRVLEHGTFEELTNDKSGSEVQRLLVELQKATDETRSSSESNSKGMKKSEGSHSPAQKKAQVDGPSSSKASTKGDAGLTTKEERKVGAVSWSVYQQYLMAGGGWGWAACAFVPFLLGAANALATTSWVSIWTSDANYERNSEAFYLGIYAFLAVTLGICSFYRSYFVARFGIRASERLHSELTRSVLQAPQEFFDTTPLGRILSRFSKDMYSIDVELVTQLDFVVFMALSVIVSLGSIVFVTPWFGLAVLPLAFVYFRILNYFRSVSRETKRLESISRSPVYAHFSETLGGLSTIRAYAEPRRFAQEFQDKIDQNTRAYYCNKAADRWLAVRLEVIGAAIAGLAGIFAVNVAVGDGVSGQDSGSNFASLAGLSLTFAISMTGMLNWVIRSFSQLEASMTATERILYFSENISQEAPRTAEDLKVAASENPNDDDDDGKPPALRAVSMCGGEVEQVPKDWPQKGQIVLQNLMMKYRADTPLVLKGLNLIIKGGERIGVVGRTGSGKSSLLLTLLRLVEPQIEGTEPYVAPVSIDGVDTMRIGLEELRSRMGIIPQNPVLFSGTIKSNIDPFDEYTDEEIWNALERCSMKESVEAMPGGLEAAVAEYGENLSAGMRQMLVLGRALLKKCRILLLDEATSSVDYETGKLK